MRPKFDKIKLSRHQRDNLAQGISGHQYDERHAERLVDEGSHTRQEDGRDLFHGLVEGKPVQTTISATFSASYSIGRVVTTHRRGRPKKVNATHPDRPEKAREEGD
jgi:hypothetical protein